jgi:FG-GAP repeat
VKQATLTPRNEANGVAFGAAVALSADGNTALVGGPVETFSVGAGMNSQSPILSAVWVFVRSGSTWTEQAKLTPNDVIFGEPSFGASVALSADGDTAMFGGPAEAWIFRRVGAGWRQQGKKLAPRDGSAGARFGESAALAADGSTALIGGTGFANDAGAAWVFARSGATWRQQGPRLTPKDAAGEAFFGEAVALSATGGTALIGGPYDGGSTTTLGSGAAWVFARSRSVWRQEGAKLVPSGRGVHGPDSFGSSVALSGNGGTALVGGARAGAIGSGKNAPPGSAWIFARSGGTWKQRSALSSSDGVKSAHGVAFGQSVALTSAGDVALVGGPEDASAGAVWTFVSAAPA